MKILNLDPKENSPLYWVGEILYNRRFPDISKKIYSYIAKNWKINTDGYDVILGYTADDQYFSIFKDFINNKLSFQGLCKALMLGDLGYQYVIRMEQAYKQLKKAKQSEIVLCEDFEQLGRNRRDTAKYNYSLIREEHQDVFSDEIFFTEIIKRDISPDNKLLSFPFSDIREDARIDSSVLDEIETINNTRDLEDPIYPGCSPAL